ncbi:MAG TPA: caspase family protein [Humibacillus sp.]|nr:caspase family protein [Humibacillus sp.]
MTSTTTSTLSAASTASAGSTGSTGSAQRNVYALLVGIDAYPAPVPALSGCRNDIEAVEALLTARVTGTGHALHVRSLTDEEATRAAVIDGFREHLAQATSDDVAFFYYSGHGSQEPAPPEWWHLEPDHLDETLVLHDSRTEGQWDLADKELSVLIAEVAASDPHIVIVLDCCHSGSGTRAPLEDGLAGRQAPTDRRSRPLDSFLFDQHHVEELVRSRLPERDALGDSGWTMPSAHHVLLTGCRSNETSKEIVHGGTHRGAMSAALEVALSSGGDALTYREIHRQVSAQVRRTVRYQSPQLETTTTDDLDRPFLGGAVSAPARSFVVTHNGREWTVDGGLVHGLAAPVRDEQTLLEIRDSHDTAVATAAITAARSADATITLTTGDLDPARSYRATVTATPLPPLLVRLEPGPGTAALRSALADRDQHGPLLVAEVEGGEEAQVQVTPDGAGYAISRIASERELCPRADTPDEAIGVLEHIAAWQRVADLSNPATQLPHDAVAVSVVAEIAPGEVPFAEVDGLHRFDYHQDPGGAQRPRPFTVSLTNTTQRPLWVSLLDLTDTFGIFADAVAAGSTELQPGERLPIELETGVPDELWDRGVTEVTDLLKLIVSTEEFDPRSLAQPDLEVSAPLRVDRGLRQVGPMSSLDRLLHHVGTRRAKPVGAADDRADWLTRDIQVVAVRPRPGVAISSDSTVKVAPGVRIDPHPSLRATVQLSGAPNATRDLSVAPLPSPLHEAGTTPFGLISSRGDESESDALVITLDGAGDPSAVTASQPLVLRLDKPLEPDAHVLPLAWDGEFYVPLGFGHPSGAGTEIVLQRLCAPVSTQRSLAGSIRILFRKLVGKALGLPPAYPLLRMATVADDGTVTYESTTSVVKAAVGAADAVLLYVHGIIGDTEGMVRSSRLSGSASPIGERYDVVLTFDYENLDTPIEENAASLQSMLRDVGLATGHGKRLDIVAHSMGGLVARHLIELDGGADVDRLITLGTPNSGSPWPTVQRWATAAVALAANGFIPVAWPVTALAALLGAVEKVDTALDEMQPGSPFLTRLSGAPDPGMSYHVIVGNRALVPDAEGQPNGRVARLMGRLAPSHIGGEIVDLVFFNQPNDLAVSVQSASSVPVGRQPAPQVHVVATDHVSFFEDPASLAVLADVVSA